MVKDQIPLSVLVINSSKNHNKQIINTLKTQKFEVSSTCISRVDEVKENQPDIFVIDLNLPEDEGWQICRKIRTFSKMPILVLSLIDKPGMVERTLDAGADEYLLKPITSNMLLARIKTLTRRSQAEKKAILSHSEPSLPVVP